jgi:hypothetical protein
MRWIEEMFIRESRPFIAVDFDGVLHSYTSECKNMAIVIDPPVDGAVDFIKEAVKHFNVVIYSVRCGSKTGIIGMKKWLSKWGFPINELLFSDVKPVAKLYIDDRGYTFNGKFPNIDFIKNFKTWNENKKNYIEIT